jgi:putative toxin-antitoxin system antitoxin component (TIGR02293 family)
MPAQTHSVASPELPVSIYGRIGATLGIRSLQSDQDAARLVEKRLSTSVLKSLVQHGLDESEVYELVIPRRTLSHRKARRERLTRDESDRAMRVGRIVALAGEVFGEEERALRWLRKPHRRFMERPPLELLATEAGARLIEEALHQIDDGMYV